MWCGGGYPLVTSSWLSIRHRRTNNLDGGEALEEGASVFQLGVIRCCSDLDVLREVEAQLENCFYVRVFMREVLFDLRRVGAHGLRGGEENSVYLFELCT
jgi:hypothetical protein